MRIRRQRKISHIRATSSSTNARSNTSTGWSRSSSSERNAANSVADSLGSRHGLAKDGIIVVPLEKRITARQTESSVTSPKKNARGDRALSRRHPSSRQQSAAKG